MTTFTTRQKLAAYSRHITGHGDELVERIAELLPEQVHSTTQYDNTIHDVIRLEGLLALLKHTLIQQKAEDAHRDIFLS